jgi:hypothetical protein
MKRNKVLLILSLALVLSIMAIAFPATPAAAAQGSLNISQYSGPVGTIVQINGTGYTAGTIYTIAFRQSPYVGLFSTSITGTVSSTGKIQTNYAIPAFPKGIYEFNATTSTVGGVATDTTGILPTFYNKSHIVLNNNTERSAVKYLLAGTDSHPVATPIFYFNNNPLYGTIASSTGTFSNMRSQSLTPMEEMSTLSKPVIPQPVQ